MLSASFFEYSGVNDLHVSRQHPIVYPQRSTHLIYTSPLRSYIRPAYPFLWRTDLHIPPVDALEPHGRTKQHPYRSRFRKTLRSREPGLERALGILFPGHRCELITLFFFPMVFSSFILVFLFVIFSFLIPFFPVAKDTWIFFWNVLVRRGLGLFFFLALSFCVPLWQLFVGALCCGEFRCIHEWLMQVWTFTSCLGRIRSC